MTSYYSQTKSNVLTGAGEPLAELLPHLWWHFPTTPHFVGCSRDDDLTVPKDVKLICNPSLFISICLSLTHFPSDKKPISHFWFILSVLSSKSLSLTLSSKSSWSCHLMTYPSPPLLNFLLPFTMTWWYITHVPMDWCLQTDILEYLPPADRGLVSVVAKSLNVFRITPNPY